MKKRLSYLSVFAFGILAAAIFAAEADAPAASRWAGLTGLFLAYLTGLGLSFTPCVWPMYPITSSVIIGSSAVKTKKMAFLLSVVYLLGLAFAYTILGAVTGKLGEVAANYLKSAWLVAAMAAIFIVFGLSMLGLFEINLPASFTSRFMKDQRKGVTGVFAMGFISA
ncbi:MAG TPA: cytochrome c biogenesis protein CcdA, partial [Candidatus Sumerlaeia bacterium]|nr:cytochrome c biogenesis protein CcdA [Candidatus Sumerlaeia bacterium]